MSSVQIYSNILPLSNNSSKKASFRANININYKKVEQSLVSDKFFNEQAKEQIRNLLRQIDKLSVLKEKSNVEIHPRLDNNKLSLIATVSNEANDITTTITERCARKLATDENFANRFFNHIKQAIVNVDITSKELSNILKFIEKSKNIKDTGFINNLATSFLAQLDKGNNPTKRILEILQKIEQHNTKTCNIAIKDIKSYGGIHKRSTVRTNFSVTNENGEKLVPITYLLKDPIDNLFR